jgi:hypothetical protein
MTLDTSVFVTSKLDYRLAWVKCNQLIGAHEGITFTDEDGYIWNKAGQGLCALLGMHYGTDAPLVADGGHHQYCEPDDGEAASHRLCFPHWLEISFDTPYGYRDADGNGCGDLHARLVAELGQWLDGRGASWKWENEVTGEVHDGYAGLTELARSGARATQWFRTIVAPALGLPAS